MKVAIAISSKGEIDQLRKQICEEHEALVITPDVDPMTLGERCDIVVLDEAFAPRNSLDFLRSVITVSELPVVLLAPTDNQAWAVQALRIGAFTYLLKTTGYLDLVPLAIAEASKRFEDQEQARETIAALQKRVADLKAELGADLEEPAAPIAPTRKQRAEILNEIVGRLQRGDINLPVYPPINVQFRKLLRSQAPYSEIAALLSQDVSLTSKLLSVANSPYYYRGSRKATNLKDALGRLGLTVARNYVELLTNRSLYTTNSPTYQPLLNQLWDHSRACAHAAYALAVRLRIENPDDLFTMGILHDIGSLFLLQVIIELASGNALAKAILPQDLHECLMSNHTHFGAALLKRWNLDEEFVRVARYHEDPQEADPMSKSLCVVSVADLLVQQMGYGRPVMSLDDSFALKYLDVSKQVLDEVADEVSRLMAKTPVNAASPTTSHR